MISKEVKQLLKDCQQLIRENNFKAVYEETRERFRMNGELHSELTNVFLSSGINPLLYLEIIPFFYLGYDNAQTDLNIPKNIIAVTMFAFDSSKLENVVFQEGCTAIYDFAFGDCKELKHVVLPSTLTELGNKIFQGCENLTEIHYRGTTEQWTNIKRNHNWLHNVNVKKVICSNGEIPLNV